VLQDVRLATFGLCVAWTVHGMDCAWHGLCMAWTCCGMDCVWHGLCVAWTVCGMDSAWHMLRSWKNMQQRRLVCTQAPGQVFERDLACEPHHWGLYIAGRVRALRSKCKYFYHACSFACSKSIPILHCISTQALMSHKLWLIQCRSSSP